jgi:SAM-dependent methyltransferase
LRKKEKQSVENLLSPLCGSTLIDLGCGTGFYSLFLKEKYNLDILGIDSSPSMIENLLARGIKGKIVSIEELGHLELFDNALAAGVLEFVKQPEKVFENVHAILHSGVKLVLLIPVNGFWGFVYRIYHNAHGCPAFIRDLQYYEAMAKSYGFKKLETEKSTLISWAISFQKV